MIKINWKQLKISRRWRR